MKCAFLCSCSHRTVLWNEELINNLNYYFRCQSHKISQNIQYLVKKHLGCRSVIYIRILYAFVGSFTITFWCMKDSDSILLSCLLDPFFIPDFGALFLSYRYYKACTRGNWLYALNCVTLITKEVSCFQMNFVWRMKSSSLPVASFFRVRNVL